MARYQPKLISEEGARIKWNSMSRNAKEILIKKLSRRIHSKDRGEAHRYFYGNLYPKTRQAIRRYLS